MRRAVFLLHGFCSGTADYDVLIPGLIDRYDYIKVCLYPGHGVELECKNFKARQTLENVINDFDELAKEYDCIDVIGYSLGGVIASYLAAIRRINKLIFLAPAHRYFNLGFQLRKVGDFLRRKKKDNIENKDNFKVVLPKNTFSASTNFLKLVNYCKRYLTYIIPPSLIIYGQNDSIIPFSSIKLMCSLCINHYLIVEENLTHAMLKGKRKDFLQENIFDFIDYGLSLKPQ